MNALPRHRPCHRSPSAPMPFPRSLRVLGANSVKPAWGAIFGVFAIAFTACISQAGATPALSLPEQPLAFEANHGQTDPQVAYLARGKGYMLFLEPTEAILALKSHSAVRRLSMRLLGAASRPPMHPSAALPGRHNYYIGNDPKQWHTGIPTYARVVSRGVYPGIDMIYHGKAGQLEYDFRVAPGADPGAIRLAIAGSDAMTVNARGDLVLKVGGEQVIHRAPYAYQTRHGAKVAVDARYRLHGRTVAFQLGDYDHARPLIIDPTLIYASYIGGTGDDTARAIAVDAAGNIYITGQTNSPDLPQAGNYPSGGTSDAFVTKLDSSGAVVFSTYIGSHGTNEPGGPPNPLGLSPGTEAGEKGNGIAIGPQGKIYITGGTEGNYVYTKFPTLNPYQANCLNNDAFVTILDVNGSLDYSTCVGGGLYDEGLGIAVDSSGNAYVVGYTTSQSTNVGDKPFPTTSGALQTAKISDPNVRESFFFELNPNLSGTSQLVYSTYLGSGSSKLVVSSTYATAVTVDSFNNAYIAGWTMASAAELPPGFPTTNAYQTTNHGLSDSFVYEINPASSTPLLYATFLGGSGDDRATGVAVDGSGKIYVAGQTTSIDFPTSSTGLYKKLNGGANSDGFIAKINPASGGVSDLLYATYLGGGGDDGIQGIAVNGTGQIYVTGWTEGGFPVTNGSVHNLGGNYKLDAFLTGLDTTKSAPIFSTYYGGNDDDMGRGIALARDSSDKVYITGATLSGDPGDLQVSNDAAKNSNTQGISDGFVASFGTVADMGVTMTATDPPPIPFGTMTYTVDVTNKGPDPASNVVLTLQVQASGAGAPPLDQSNLKYPTSECSNPSLGSDQEIFTCHLGSMGSGAVLPGLTFSGPITTYATVTATATVSADQADTDPSNNAIVAVSQPGQGSVIQNPTTVGGGGGSTSGGSVGGSSGGGSLGPLALAALLGLLLIRTVQTPSRPGSKRRGHQACRERG